jgi:hypothetical protein
MTGPVPERPPMNLAFRNSGASQEEFREAELRTIAFRPAMRRRFPRTPDDGQTVFMVMIRNDTVPPHFRKGELRQPVVGSFVRE